MTTHMDIPTNTNTIALPARQFEVDVLLLERIVGRCYGVDDEEAGQLSCPRISKTLLTLFQAFSSRITYPYPQVFCFPSIDPQ